MKFKLTNLKADLKHPFSFKNNKHGFTLLFAVLVSSMLLAIGASILQVNYKEFILSAFGRESQFSFYAADSGIECAIYWDYKHPGLAKSPFATSSPLTDINCAESTFPIVDEGGDQRSFAFTFPAPERYHAEVLIYKFYGGPGNAVPLTAVESRGYNVPPNTPSVRKVERGIRVNYQN